MANNYETGQKIVNEALRIIHNRSAMLGRVSKRFEKEFKGHPGDTIYIPRQPQFTIRDGPVASIQDLNQTKVAMTIQPEFGVDLQISDADLALRFDQLSRDVIQPAASRIATELDLRMVTVAMQATYNSVGTPGTPPSSTAAAQKLALDAGVLLTNNGADMNGRMMVTNPAAEANFLQYLNQGFNHQGKIGDQYVTGSMTGYGRALGFDWYSSPNMKAQTVGPLGGTPLVNGANQGTINSGATDNPRADTTTLITDGWTAAAANRVKKGDIFTIAGVYAVNQDNKQVSASLQQFTVTADASSDGSGNLTMVISPAIVAGGAFQNVSARPADNAALTFLGTAGTAYPVSLAFVEDAFAMATVPLELPNGMDMANRAEMDGVSIRFVRGYDITNNRRICRFDVMAGYAALRPEWSTRVYAG